MGIFSNLKQSLRTISIRLPEGVIEALKALANKAEVPYQSLMKIFLADRVEEELQGNRIVSGALDRRFKRITEDPVDES